MIDEAFDAGGDVIARIAGELFVGQQDDARAHDVVASGQATDRFAEPADDTAGIERQIVIARSVQPCGACFELQRKRPHGGGFHSLAIRSVYSRRRGEPETGQLPDMMSFHEDITIYTDFSFQHRILSQAPHEHSCPAVYKAFRQPFM